MESLICYTPKTRNLLFLVVGALAMLFCGCGDSSTDPDPSSEFDIQITSTSSYGQVLTDGEGKPLYVLTLDVKGESQCSIDCISNWPVFYAEELQLGNGLEADNFGTITRLTRNNQTTFNGWPLYYYSGDDQPGVVNGDGAGGVWHVAKPNYSLMIASQQLVGGDGNNYRIDENENYVQGDEITSHIVDIKGRTLYIFAFDSANTNNFTNEDFSNNGVWPIYHIDIDALPSSIDKENFGEITVHGERLQLTYKGWPLYYFGQDEMKRGNTRGVSFPQPGIWPVAQKEMDPAPGYSSDNNGNDGNTDGPDY